jgi:hypothetical protein
VACLLQFPVLTEATASSAENIPINEMNFALFASVVLEHASLGIVVSSGEAKKYSQFSVFQ